MAWAWAKSRPPVGSFFALCAGGLHAAAALAQDLDAAAPVRWALTVQSEQYSDALAWRDFGQPGWVTRLEPRHGSNFAQIDRSIVLSRAQQGQAQQWALVARQLGRVVLDEASLRRMAQMGGAGDAGQDWHWDAQLRYQAFSAYGLDWQYLAPVREGWFAQGGVQALNLTSLSGRTLGGEVDFNALRSQYAFNAQSQQYGNRLHFPFEKPFDNQGQALLVQGRMGWRAQSWHVAAGVRDAGWLWWRGLPVQTLNLNTQTQGRDADGYVLYKPLIEGKNGQSDGRWSAPWTGDLEAAWHAGSQQVWSLPWRHVPRVGWLPAVRWQNEASAAKWALTWRMRQQDVLGQWQWGRWGFSYAVGHARNSQQWGVGYAYVFE